MDAKVQRPISQNTSESSHIGLRRQPADEPDCSATQALPLVFPVADSPELVIGACTCIQAASRGSLLVEPCAGTSQSVQGADAV
jgi:hypothetical protein